MDEQDLGWIKIHRKIQECLFWQSNEPFDKRSAWIDLILMVNHEDKEILVNGIPLIVHRGQRFTSIRKLAEKWGWSKSKVERYFSVLDGAKMAVTSKTHNGTLITVLNYDKYQHSWDTSEDTDEDTHETLTRTRSRHRRVTNKNDKNDKNEKNEKKIEASPLTDPWGNEFQ